MDCSTFPRIRKPVYACLLAAGLIAVVTSSAVQAQVASALLQEDGPLPGLPGETISSISNTAVNHVGGYAVTVNTSGTATLSNVWGSATRTAGSVLRTEGTIGDFTQTSFESFFGLADDGKIHYGTTDTNNVTLETGLDSVYLSDEPVLREGDSIASVGGELSTFNSRPGVTGNGIPYWAGGFTSGFGGSTANRALFMGSPPTPLLMGGDFVTGVVEPVKMSTLDFDYRMSEAGSSYIIAAAVDASSSIDTVLIVDGAAVMIDGQIVREGSPVAAVAGGLSGENWANFDYLGINESGNWFATGDTSADTSMDEFVMKDGAIVLREGDMIDGYTISGAIEGGYMNADGDWAVIWDVDTISGNVEALILNGSVVLLEGDAVDWNNDGVIDANDNSGNLANFTGVTSLTVGDRLPNGDVDLYFTADIDFLGTSSTTDDLEGYFRLSVSTSTGCLPGDVNQDTSIDLADMSDFVDVLLDPDAASANAFCAADVNEDSLADGADVQRFVNCVLAGGCP